MKISTDLIKKLRDETGAGVMRIKVVLEEVKGDEKKALEILKKEGFEKSAKRADRETGQGIVVSYIHHSNKVGVLVEILCETDFVARTSEFKNLVHEICMQAAAMNPKDVKALLKQEYIRDNSKTIESLIKETIAKLGENIVVKRLQRFEIGYE